MASAPQSSLGTLQTQPQTWPPVLFLVFGGAQLIAAVIFFFAYNWRDLSDLMKIAAPQAAMALGFIIWVALGSRSRLGALGGILATIMIGVSMGVVGQVYQLGADPWRLFAIWAAFALPLAIIARNDAHFAVWFAIATVAWFAFAAQVWSPHLPEATRASIIPAVYVIAAIAVLFVREQIMTGAPGWLRWLIVAVALFVGLSGAGLELFGWRGLFKNGLFSSFALLAACAALFAAYRQWRPDKPVQAMAMFAVAAWAAATGVRLIVTIDAKGAGDISVLLFMSAGWIIAMTWVLALGFRRFIIGRPS